MMSAYDIVVVGTSWGGLSALRTLVGSLPGAMDLPVVCIQHRHRDSDTLLATLLQDHARRPVCEVEDKMPIERARVYIAPADYHLLVDRGSFTLSVDDAVRYSRPSIDVTFESAADAYGRAVIGVVLTGANADGAAGLRRIVARGGLGLVQSPLTAESPTMPQAAIAAVPSAQVLDLPGIAGRIAEAIRPFGFGHQPGAGAVEGRP
jgi:two-component system, chemotaxis family, protein-glutamate methylesterase/glutaminase